MPHTYKAGPAAGEKRNLLFYLKGQPHQKKQAQQRQAEQETELETEQPQTGQTEQHTKQQTEKRGRAMA